MIVTIVLRFAQYRSQAELATSRPVWPAKQKPPLSP